MLLFVSDLHLSDREETSGAHVPALLAELEVTLERARELGVEEARLVLLGDIFELLKSERWLDSEARPWLPPSAEAADVVSAVFRAILAEHSPFFTGLTALTQRFDGLACEYLPGNHDRELNTSLGAAARAELRRWLPLAGTDDEPFSTLVIDPEHGTLAKHGHEWDRQNRTSEGVAAVGDAVVIEVVTRLPALVRAAVSSLAGLAFLEELDNVSPQEPRAMAEWLLAGFDGLGAEGAEVRQVVAEALGEALGGFCRALETTTFESVSGGLWTRWLGGLVEGLTQGLDPIALAARLPRVSKREPGPSHHARLDLETAALAGLPCRFLVSGHTHHAEAVPLALLSPRKGPPPVYLNTGTWRRVHTRVEPAHTDDLPAFASSREECLVATYSEREQARGLPAFEMRTFRRGGVP